MSKDFLKRVKAFHKELHQQESGETHINKKKKRTLSMLMAQKLVDELQKYDNVYFQYRTLANFSKIHKDPRIKQRWTENEWKQWRKKLRLLIQQLPPMECIALAA
jgi:hypothetical protein